MKTTDNQEEILIVVDEEDTILDYLPRSEVHAKNLLHRTISVIVQDSSGKLVLQKRSMSKDSNPGMLGNAVGGHVIKGQSYEEAAKQEAKEELGRLLDITGLKKLILDDPTHRTMTTIFKAVADAPYEYNHDEIDEMILVDLQDLPKVVAKMAPSGKLILKAIGILKE